MQNFFKLYYDYTRSNEPPANYHAWCGISAISALLGKKCFIPQGKFTTFPNTYVVLVGVPATRKSTAMNVAKGLVRACGKVPLSPESATRESLIDDMARSRVEWNLNGKDISYWQSSAFVTELEQFIGGKHINDAMVKFLTAIWDEPFFKERTRKGGEVIIHNPYFTMLACCTTSWMNDKLQADVISDGFTRRTIFVFESEINCLNPWPTNTPEEEALVEPLTKEALRIFNIGGQFNLTPQAREKYDALYMNQRKMAEKHSHQLEHYFSSRHILIQKISMCLSAACRSDKIIDSRIIELANVFLLETEKNLDRLFAGVGRNELAPVAARILDILAKRGSLTATQIFSDLTFADINSVELDLILDTLVASGNLSRDHYQSASEHPVEYALVKKPEKQESVNLLELASRLEASSETLSAETASFVQLPEVAPETARLLSRQEEKKVDSAQGLLLRGKSPKPLGNQEVLSALGLGLSVNGKIEAVRSQTQPSLPGLEQAQNG